MRSLTNDWHFWETNAHNISCNNVVRMMMAIECYIAVAADTDQPKITSSPESRKRTLDRANDDCIPTGKRPRHCASSTCLTRTRKHVRFSTKDTVTEVESFADELTPTLWYQEDEYQRIREEAIDTVSALDKTTNGDLSTLDFYLYCSLRGLEHVIAHVLYRVLRQRSKRVVNAVLCQQQMQRQTGHKNVESIRLSSFIMSTADQRKARTRAQTDILVI